VPEVVQPSATDCGPAVLAAGLRGHGHHVNQAELRERCLTDVDGTSVSVLAHLAAELGLEADEVVVPVDHVTRADAGILPAIAVTVLPDGLAHFVLLWRRVGPFIQVMDPAVGRRWVRETALREELYLHRQRVPAAAWRSYAATEPHLSVLRGRLADIGIDAAGRDQLLRRAVADPTWLGLASLDAAVRKVDRVVDEGGDRLDRLYEFIADPYLPPDGGEDRDWSVVPAGNGGDGDNQLWLRGAVVVKVHPGAATSAVPGPASRSGSARPHRTGPDGASTASDLVDLVATRHRWWPGAFLLAGCLTGLLGVAETVVLRDVVTASGSFARAIVLTGLGGLALLAFQATAQAMGRHLERSLRASITDRLPRVADRYVASRPASDLTERMHTLHRIGDLPGQAAVALGATAQAVVGAIVLVSTVPSTAVAVGVLVLATVTATLVAQPGSVERELRTRSIAGGLGQSLTDAFAGSAALRAHRGGPALTFRHESLLRSWLDAARARHRWAAGTAGASRLIGLLGAGWVIAVASGAGAVRGELLLVGFLAVFVALDLDAATAAVRSLPGGLTAARRLLEPMEAPREPWSRSVLPGEGGIRIELEGVQVDVAGRALLRDVDLQIPAGCHVAVVGRSGAGKSTLLSIMLGLAEPSAGRVLVDGEPFDDERAGLRRATAWVDPGVAIWSGSVLDNVAYGNAGLDAEGVARAACEAGLTMDKASGASVGVGGVHLSGADGQRLRLARAMARQGTRLVVGDEALRGLGAVERAVLHGRCREVWSGATVLWVTHDLEEAATFDLIVVVEDGRVIEQGAPEALGVGSRFEQLRQLSAPLPSGPVAVAAPGADGRSTSQPLAPLGQVPPSERSGLGAELRRHGVLRSVISSVVWAAVSVVGTAVGFAMAARLAFGEEAGFLRWCGLSLAVAVSLVGHLVAAGAAATATGLVIRRRMLAAVVEGDEGLLAFDGVTPMASVLDVDAIDRSSVSAGLLCVEGIIDVALAVLALVVTGAGPALTVALGAALLAALAVSMQVVRRQVDLARKRVELSSVATESLLGHRTRLVQADPSEPRHDETLATDGCLTARRSVDRWSLVGLVAVPVGWQVGALALVAAATGPPTLAGQPQLAAVLGSVLLGTVGLSLVGVGTRAAAEGAVASRALLRRLRDLERQEPEQWDPTEQPGGGSGDLPLDSARSVAVPSFSRNHIFEGPLVYNVLMGRGWPSAPGDEEWAEELCRDLGLADLLDRMPAGMSQMVGETGWRLSHGERSRLYLARGLAQEPDVLILDDTFEALDSTSARKCLGTVKDRCATILMVEREPGCSGGVNLRTTPGRKAYQPTDRI